MPLEKTCFPQTKSTSISDAQSSLVSDMDASYQLHVT